MVDVSRALLTTVSNQFLAAINQLLLGTLMYYF